MFFHRLRAAFEILRCTEQVAVLSSKVTPQRPGTGGPDKDLLVWGEEGDGEGLAKGGQKEVTMLVEPRGHGIRKGIECPQKSFSFQVRESRPHLTLAVAFRTLRSACVLRHPWPEPRLSGSKPKGPMQSLRRISWYGLSPVQVTPKHQCGADDVTPERVLQPAPFDAFLHTCFDVARAQAHLRSHDRDDRDGNLTGESA